MPITAIDQFNKIKHNRTYLLMVVFLIFIAITWVIFSITLSNTREQVDPKIIQMSKITSPVVDEEVFSLIAKKHHYTDQELNAFTIYKINYDKDKKQETIVPIETKITP